MAKRFYRKDRLTRSQKDFIALVAERMGEGYGLKRAVQLTVPAGSTHEHVMSKFYWLKGSVYLHRAVLAHLRRSKSQLNLLFRRAEKMHARCLDAETDAPWSVRLTAIKLAYEQAAVYGIEEHQRRLDEGRKDGENRSRRAMAKSVMDEYGQDKGDDQCESPASSTPPTKAVN